MNMPQRSDEALLWAAVDAGETARAAGERLGIHHRRVDHLCEKWTRQGRYDYGVCVDMGWPVRAKDDPRHDDALRDAPDGMARHDAPENLPGDQHPVLGPEVVFGAVERHLLTNLLPRPTMEDRMTDQATTTQATETTHDVTSSPLPRRSVGPVEVVVTNLVPGTAEDVKWAMEQLAEHASEVDAVRVAPDVWEALHGILDGETAGDAATAGPRITVDNLLRPGTWAADVSPLMAANTVTETGPATDPEATTA